MRASRRPTARPARIAGARRKQSSVRLRETDLGRLHRLVMQGELAATAVHEISNLQTMVLLNAGLLREAQKDNPGVTRYVDPLLHAAGLVANLCSQLRSLAHPLAAQACRIDLRATARNTFQLLEQVVARELRFEAGGDDALPIRADPGQLDQMLINLVLNARDATAEEGGRIIVRVGRRARGWCFLEVEDNGAGMTPAVRARVGRKFFTTKEPGRGTGLGLATVNHLLTRMGGRLGIHSRAGRGTRMRLEFPRARDVDAPAT